MCNEGGVFDVANGGKEGARPVRCSCVVGSCTGKRLLVCLGRHRGDVRAQVVRQSRWVAVGHHGGGSDVVYHVMLEGREVGQRKQMRAACCKLGHRHAGRVEVGQVATEVRRVGVEVGELRQFCIELRQKRVDVGLGACAVSCEHVVDDRVGCDEVEASDRVTQVVAVRLGDRLQDAIAQQSGSGRKVAVRLFLVLVLLAHCRIGE